MEENLYHISIVKNTNGVLSFEMTDFEDVVHFQTVEGCLSWFGLDTSDESIRQWTAIAHSNDYTRN